MFANQNVPVILDTGVSLLITPEKTDFIKPPNAPRKRTKLGVVEVILETKGMGTTK
jgi:hypothetical protein